MRMCTVLPGDPSLVHRAHIGWLTTSGDSSSKRSQAFPWPLKVPSLTGTYPPPPKKIHTHIIKNRSLKIEILKILRLAHISEITLKYRKHTARSPEKMGAMELRRNLHCWLEHKVHFTMDQWRGYSKKLEIQLLYYPVLLLLYCWSAI